MRLGSASTVSDKQPAFNVRSACCIVPCHFTWSVAFCGRALLSVASLVLSSCVGVQEPHNIAAYKAHNVFLADINNDRDTKNSLYKDNLVSLNKFIMFRFKDDTMVVPRDSAWFGWFNGTQLLTMNETALYKVWRMPSSGTKCLLTLAYMMCNGDCTAKCMCVGFTQMCMGSVGGLDRIEDAK